MCYVYIFTLICFHYPFKNPIDNLENETTEYQRAYPHYCNTFQSFHNFHRMLTALIQLAENCFFIMMLLLTSALIMTTVCQFYDQDF